MITLVTGIPGHGKTQLIVAELAKDAKKNGLTRPVFANVAGLDHDTLRTNPLDDPERWFDLPDGSLIIIDECQRWFRPRANGAPVPEHVSRLETHRHNGFDLIVITQHPKLIDNNLRNLVDRHRHCVRPYGVSYRKVFDFMGVNDNPAIVQGPKDAQCEKVPFDRSVYSLYKSATEHTHKSRLPYKKFVGLAAFCLMVIVGSSIAFSRMTTPMRDDASVSPLDADLPAPSAPAAPDPFVPPMVPGHESESPQMAVLPDSWVGSTGTTPDSVYVRVGGVVYSVADFDSHDVSGAALSVYWPGRVLAATVVLPPDQLGAFAQRTATAGRVAAR